MNTQEFNAELEDRCNRLRPSGFHPQAWKNEVAKQLQREIDAQTWVSADPEMIRQCSTDGML